MVRYKDDFRITKNGFYELDMQFWDSGRQFGIWKRTFDLGFMI